MRRKIRAKDIMSRNIVSVVPGSTVQDAAELMERNNIGALPVISAGKIRGMITDRDIIVRCISKRQDPAQVKAEEIMSTAVAYTTPDQSIGSVLDVMAAERVRRLPVVEDGIVQGMISFADVALNSVSADTDRAIAETIGEISEDPSWTF